jgi:hypothetical protein
MASKLFPAAEAKTSRYNFGVIAMETAAKCVDCADWFGCCHSGRREKRLRHNHVASSDACSEFKPKKPKEQT